MAQTIALTISRQVAAGGEPIGRLLAQNLGMTFINRAILRQTVGHLKKQPVAERPAGFWSGLLGMFAVGGQPTTGGMPAPAPYESDRPIFEAEARIIKEVAGRRDIVLVGRAGFSVLADHPGLVSIFLMAPRQHRAAVLQKALALTSQEEALAVLDQCDRARGEFLESVSGRRWNRATNYHLCLDTSRLDKPDAAGMIGILVEKIRQALKG